MSFVLKAQHASDSSTPKISHTVSDIAVKTRETRSDNPETFYHLSPTKKTDEETFSPVSYTHLTLPTILRV